MSRTYRKFPVTFVYWHSGEFFYHWKNKDYTTYPSFHYKSVERFDVKSTDRKPWFKPDGVWKRDRRRNRRAKEKHAMRNDKEIPFFKKEDQRDWN